VSIQSFAGRSARAGLAEVLDHTFVSTFLKVLSGISVGQLRVFLPDGTAHSFGAGSEPAGILIMRSTRMARRCILRGGLGLAEGYMAGEWESPDLVGVIEVFARNDKAISRLKKGTLLTRCIEALRHAFRANTKRGSRSNIAYHYDLGNAFYRVWLDETMTYSAARFASPGDTLAVAQTNKYQAIAAAAGVKSGDRVLEIGCGWGGFARYLSDRLPVAYRGISLSNEQLRYAEEACSSRKGLEFRYEDYRDTKGEFDRIVSIEMFEAVGEAYWPIYFQSLKRLLSPDGRVVLQVIVLDLQRFAARRRSPDFIQAYVFPGGMLPTIDILLKLAEQAGFEVEAMSSHGADYAKTLSAWTARFEEATDRVRALGYDERFVRMWRYYLAYCEGGFRAGSVDVVQLTLSHRPVAGAAAKAL
jgi:cyclopropane-fatty-acyl-phospholipid synthase